jgi:2,4-dienoyl-CoA reductase-like NADH-dependent reductase (Old Yellow Enzyme family)/thioredoxin reductase
MTQPFPHLFQPLTLRHLTLRNRIVFGAHTANMSVDGLPGERHLGYYRERARGGAAMIVVEPVPVHATAVLTRGNFRHSDDAVIPHFRRIAEAVHAEGAAILQQLYHVGAHADWDNSFEANWSPSGLPSMHDQDGSHAMTEGQILELVEAFGQAARRAREAGFDGVEIMGAYNALLEQFWSPFCNRRDDAWGGSFEKRMRFSEAVLTRIREICGESFVIGVAISVDPTRPDVLAIEDHQEIAAWHDARGLYDYVTVGTGSYFEFTRIMPTFQYGEKLGPPYAAQLKQVVKHARVQAESHIRTPENAEEVIRTGEADMVSIVRGQIADPHLANKARLGRPEDIRRCISCNQMCWGRRYRDYWISCLVNPSSGREYEWSGDTFSPAERPRKVLVVGGGPAGLEAARVAASRGHRVILAEASDKLGGRFRLAGEQPRRAQILDLLQWWETQLAKLQVEVRFNSYMDADEIRAIGADAVVIATGALPAETGYQRALPTRERLPGIERGNVWSVEDVMGKAARLGQRVLVLDDLGHWHGLGTAWALAEKGHAVTVVTPDPQIGRSIIRTAADWPLRRTLAGLKVETILESAVEEWHGDGATILDLLTEQRSTLPFDSLVLATTNVPEASLAAELASSGLELHLIGDALATRQAPAAIFEGRRLGLRL